MHLSQNVSGELEFSAQHLRVEFGEMALDEVANDHAEHHQHDARRRGKQQRQAQCYRARTRQPHGASST